MEAEQPLPDEDLAILEELQSGLGSARSVETGLRQLSFLSTADLEILVARVNNPESRQVESERLSEAGKIVWQLLAVEQVERPTIHLLQRISKSSTLRYRWRSRIISKNLVVSGNFSGDPEDEGQIKLAAATVEIARDNLRLLAGDFQFVSGYGLNFWRGSARYKGFGTVNSLPRTGSGVQPYRSFIPDWNLRGVALAMKKGCLGVNLALADQPLSVPDQSRRLPTGLLAAEFCQNSLESGMTAALANMEQSISLYARYVAADIIIFGEAARDPAGSTGWLGGVRSDSGPVRYLICGRRYALDFAGFRANPLAEWDGGANEQGLFQALEAKVGRHRLAVYGDLYQKIKVQEQYGDPLTGFENAWRWRWWKEGAAITVQQKTEERSEQSATGYLGEAVEFTERRQVTKLILTLEQNKLRSGKLEMNHTCSGVGHKAVTGQGIRAQINYQRGNYRGQFELVYTRVADYSARVYFWDINLPGEMRSRMYAQTGWYPGLRVIYRQPDGYLLAGRLRLIMEGDHPWKDSACEAGAFIEVNL